MSKTETIEKYREEYLAGKSTEAIEAFDSKTADKQYSAIMTWRYRSRKRKASAPTPEDAEAIPGMFQTMRRLLSQTSPRLSDEAVSRIEEETKSFLDFLSSYSNLVHREEIAALEARQREIASRLRELKGMTEPSLFDSLPD